MNIYEAILKAQKQGKDFAVLTVVRTSGSVPRHQNAKMLVYADGSIAGTVGGGAIEKRAMEDAMDAITKGESRLVEYKLNDKSPDALGMLCGGDADIFMEVHRGKPKLVVCGAGHVGKAISRMAVLLGFHIILLDSRPEWGSVERFPEADQIILNDQMEEAVRALEADENTFLVIATWGHKYDKEALLGALGRPFGYIGMMGSKRKVAEIFRQLLDEGADSSLLDKVHAPIGLDIGAETPEEIALSIMSEILMVKKKATGRPMSEEIRQMQQQ